MDPQHPTPFIMTRHNEVAFTSTSEFFLVIFGVRLGGSKHKALGTLLLLQWGLKDATIKNSQIQTFPFSNCRIVSL